MYDTGPHHLPVGEQEDWVGGKKEEKKEKRRKKRKAPGLLYFITCTEFSPPHNSLVLVKSDLCMISRISNTPQILVLKDYLKLV